MQGSPFSNKSLKNHIFGSIQIDNHTTSKTIDILSNHNIKEDHRAKMIDWLIQVFRVFRGSADQTFFLTISIMDRYFELKNLHNEKLDKSELHEIGLVAILIATKFEDVVPLQLDQILKDAGHSKFHKEDILTREIDVLK